MKKYFMTLCATISLISTLSAFEDKPSLGRAERAALVSTKALSTAAGSYVGAIGGGFTGARVGAETTPAPQGSLTPQQAKIHGAKETFRGMAIGATAGIGVGGYLGYKGGKSLAILALAKLHDVTYHVEAISQYYNINVSQYKSILTAAATQDPELLLQAIDEIYTLRFGQNWKERLEKLFKKYRKRARVLAKESSFNKKGNLKDFLRMVELGAAMSNLYFGTNPNPEYTVNVAIELYQELGLLQ